MEVLSIIRNVAMSPKKVRHVTRQIVGLPVLAAKNALDAMPEGGQLSIHTCQEDSYLVVKVQDSGTGISQENVNRIYDPFFTTKKAGEGSGLGLSVSYGIIQEHSGRINVETAAGQGTTFRLHLPVKRVN